MIIAMIAIGIVIVLASALYASSFFAILGISLASWGAILLYLSPSSTANAILLTEAADLKTSNIERILNELNLKEKGIYLPPKNLKHMESSLVFIPKSTNTTLPTSEEINDNLQNSKRNGILLNPPGLWLLKIIEQKADSSFIKNSLSDLQTKLPKLITEDIALAESVNLKIQNDHITLEATGGIVSKICRQADSQPKTRAQVGSVFASAIACIITKTTGNPVVVEKEIFTDETKSVSIEYYIKQV